MRREERLLFEYCKNGVLTGVIDILERYPEIDINARIGEDQRSFLFIASLDAHMDVIRVLLQHPKINVNIAKHDGETPLHRACYREYTELVELLLASPDIDVNSRDNNGETPLFYACISGSHHIVKLLIERDDCVVNAQNEKGKTALWKVCDSGYLKIVKLLVAHPKIQVNIADDQGLTPLIMANWHNSIEIIWELLKVTYMSSPDYPSEKKFFSNRRPWFIDIKNVVTFLTTKTIPRIGRHSLLAKYMSSDLIRILFRFLI